MKAIEFKGHNVVYGENQDEYSGLSAYVDVDDVMKPATFCFELDDEEIKQVKESGKIWITVATFGEKLQPILSSVLKKDF